MITEKQIVELTTSILGAQDQITGGRTTYLRTLVTAIQENLKKGQDQRTQLEALIQQHDRFYAIVLKAAEPFVPKGTKDRAIELHRRVNFARTAASAIRVHVRAGGDIATLQAAKVTKAILRVREGPARAPSPSRLKTTAERQSKQLVVTLMGLADADKQAAVEEMQLIIAQLTAQLETIGAQPAKRMKVPPLIFNPTETQIVRQQSRPS